MLQIDESDRRKLTRIAVSYLPRLVDEQLATALQRSGGVLLEGPKACGKTATALQQAASHINLDTDTSAPGLYQLDPALLLEGSTPRLLDEWQIYPDLWNHARRDIDERQGRGLFILTGSTAPSSAATRHSGAGRISRIRMRTMTWAETGESDAHISLSGLLQGTPPRHASPAISLHGLLNRLTTGGWPGFDGLSSEDTRAELRGYLRNIADVDLRDVDGSERNPQRIGRLLQALARSVATEVTVTALAKDVGTSRDTLRSDLEALERIFIVEPQPAWSTHLRSSATLRKEAKRHLADPSLAVAALGSSPDALLRDLGFAGQLFESQVVHDLRVYAELAEGTVFHARDSAGREVDAVVQLQDGSWHGFEIKLGKSPETIDAAAASLQKFAEQVDTTSPNSGLTVITNTDYSYRRADGVNVVSFSHLGA
ncbi:DUF4143 domain-containing protein [Zhihengliuella somnathii]